MKQPDPQNKQAEPGPDQELIYTNNRELFYHFDPEKKEYEQRVGYQHSANQVIIKQSWDVVEERLNEVKEQVIRGELSPIAWYMEKNLMEVPMLAEYTGFWKRTVRKHLTPKGFHKLDGKSLNKYATIFNVSTHQLQTPEF